MFELSNIRVEKKDCRSFVVSDFRSNKFGDDTIWFSVPEKYESFLNTTSYNAFFVALIYPAMMLGEDICINGKVSKKLFFSIKNYVKPFIKMYSPETVDVNITVSELESSCFENNDHVGTGYSGGVDSLCTIYDHYELEEVEDYKIDTLLFFNTGSHGVFSNKNTLNKFRTRYEYLTKYAFLPFIPLDSNIHKFLEFLPSSHIRTVSFTNASGVLALEKGINKYYVASSNSYYEAIKYGINDLNFCTEDFDSILLPLLSTESISIIADGQQYTRSQKTERIVNYELARKSLNVCINDKISDEKNCSKCSKCLRTLFTLESMDSLDNFSEVFDLKVYKKNSFKYKCEQRVMYRKNEFAKDNIDFAKLHKKHIPNIIIATIVTLPSRTIFRIKRIMLKVMGKDFCNSLKKSFGKE